MHKSKEDLARAMAAEDFAQDVLPQIKHAIDFLEPMIVILKAAEPRLMIAGMAGPQSC